MYFEDQHDEDLRRIAGFRLMDDDFMTVCLNNYKEGAELILRIILNKPDLQVTSVTTQKQIKNLVGHSLFLDVYAGDTLGRKYDIEIQRSDKGAVPQRARYHSSMLDSRLLKKNENFDSLPETYVIFITENDIIGRDLPIYPIDRVITNVNVPFDDGAHIVYVNSQKKDSATALGRLMHDFYCTDPKNMYYRQLAERVQYFKEEKKGVQHMCRVLEDMRNEVAKETKEKTKLEAAKNLIKNGKLSSEEIAAVLKMPVKKVKALEIQAS